MTLEIAPPGATRQSRTIHALIQQKGYRPGEYALFLVSGEGKLLPTSSPDDRLEEASGMLIDKSERIFAFWMSWDAASGRPVFVDWIQRPPSPGLWKSREYREARRQIGLADTE